jgi:hypothetical protein
VTHCPVAFVKDFIWDKLVFNEKSIYGTTVIKGLVLLLFL